MNIIVNTLCLFVFSLNCHSSFAQQTLSEKNAVYLELFGNGGTLLSINYERILSVKNNSLVRFPLRGGFTMARNTFTHRPEFNFPMELNSIIGKSRNFLEVGLGCTYIQGTSNLRDTIIPVGYKSNFDYVLTCRLGYRLITYKKTVIRFAPIVSFVHNPVQNKNLTVQYFFGFSYGGVF